MKMPIRDNSKFKDVFEVLSPGSALDLLRVDLHQYRGKKCCGLNSKRSLVNRKLITESKRLTKKGKELVSENN